MIQATFSALRPILKKEVIIDDLMVVAAAWPNGTYIWVMRGPIYQVLVKLATPCTAIDKTKLGLKFYKVLEMQVLLKIFFLS